MHDFENEKEMLHVLALKDVQYDELLSKYNQLQEAKHTEINKIIEKMQQSNKERESASEQVVAQWQAETAALKQRLCAAIGKTDAEFTYEEQRQKQLESECEILKAEALTLHQKVQSMQKKYDDSQSQHDATKKALAEALAKLQNKHAMSMDAELSSPSLPSQLKDSSDSLLNDFDTTQIIEAYSMLTSTRITRNGDNSVHCKCVNPDFGRVLEFDLDVDNNEIGYRPTRLQLPGVAKIPEWMNEEISFAPERATSLMKIILNTVHASSL